MCKGPMQNLHCMYSSSLEWCEYQVAEITTIELFLMARKKKRKSLDKGFYVHILVLDSRLNSSKSHPVNLDRKTLNPTPRYFSAVMSNLKIS